jgi:hypothetical protein
VIGFVYSGLQIGYLVKYLITKNHTINPKVQGYFDVAIDQVKPSVIFNKFQINIILYKLILLFGFWFYQLKILWYDLFLVMKERV